VLERTPTISQHSALKGFHSAIKTSAPLFLGRARTVFYLWPNTAVDFEGAIQSRGCAARYSRSLAVNGGGNVRIESLDCELERLQHLRRGRFRDGFEAGASRFGGVDPRRRRSRNGSPERGVPPTALQSRSVVDNSNSTIRSCAIEPDNQLRSSHPTNQRLGTRADAGEPTETRRPCFEPSRKAPRRRCCRRSRLTVKLSIRTLPPTVTARLREYRAAQPRD